MTGARTPLVVLAAGGTGGHMFPAEALAAELQGRGIRVCLVTDQRGGTYGGALGDVETHHIRAGGVAGKSFVARLQSGPELAIGLLQARGHLKRLSPDAVIGFGGYASVPTMLAAGFGGYSTALHEQNAVLGRANRLLAFRVSRIAVCFDKPEGLPAGTEGKVTRTGMPVRQTVIDLRDAPYPPLGPSDPARLLIIGGSQGARVLSDVVPAAVAALSPELRARLHVTQQCRPEDLERVRAAYGELGMTPDLESFFGDLPDRLAKAHLVIARSGASTVAELTAIGRPGILVPYPHAIDDHQARNAHAVDEAGGGWLMPEEAFSVNALAARLESLFDLPAILEKAASSARAAGRPDAACALADMVGEMLPRNGAGGDSAGGGGSHSGR